MRKMIKQVSLLLALVALTSASFAQGVVKGIIVDVATNEPLIGATIAIEGTTQGTAASLDGSFSLKVSDDNAKLVIRFVGYLDVVREVAVSGDINLGMIGLKTSSIGMEEIIVSASIARDRQTPVAVANIKAQVIEDKLGSQEFPEILKSTPSVYATKAGGGFGDSRITLRGFDSNNIGVLINGVPVNDMESGKVYWSNWAGLSDVTRIMQVQRGMGASKLALSSVGGTINIVTQSTEAKEGGVATYAIGNDGYAKKSFTISTGMLKNGWAITMSGARTTGDGYVKGTNFEGWSYFLNVSKRINDKHQLSYTVFGAPQWHNQRSSRQLIQTFRDKPDGIKFNADYGYRNGEVYSTGYAYNYYHKPQMSINHFWKINEKTSLSTSAYASLARGGGRRVSGNKSGWLGFDRNTGLPTADTKLTTDGFLDYNYVIAQNAASPNGSQAIMANGINSHDWYGVLSTLNTKISDFNLTGGADIRYYKGYHAYEVEDLLGGEYFLDAKNINRPASTPLRKGDYYNYYNLGEVAWGGLFLQGEYVKDKYSAFISGAVSNTSYRRTDYFTYLDSDPKQQSGWKNFLAYSVKGGANYNINDNHSVFVNAGYFTRAPYFNSIWINNTNEYNNGAKNEKVLSTELGYLYRSATFSANVSLYRTEWLDKSLTRTVGTEMANISGLNALHQGVEIDMTFKPFEKLEITGMASVGDWQWTSNVIANIYDQNQVLIYSGTVYAKDLHVGDAAQTTAAIGVNYEVLPKFKLSLDLNHYDNLYSYFDVNTRTNSNAEGVDAWKMPAYQLVDFSMRYEFKLGGFNTTLLGSVNNVLDTEYISDATDGATHDYNSAIGFYGFGRTWSTTLKIKF
ncbi:TonB-dependent receptor [Williamwhitmania taraxaci]|uniref:Outer membrane receptor proteins, mostly Fe transport n=1 Tax=Williamwhitmania taraxaci TaxID=1640674 RepID=A0A1G6QZC8_9BACT|nr:TonB-dependent receptor [Williamwhitmania taraxaci]SDC97165.1 Outer membrane receptor proteins, mostly Fe transport [Williamwhitmania taraxaci]